MSETLRRTPLFNFHVRNGARIVPFAGWEMPVQYTSIIDEHNAVRTKAGLFDVSHMGECRVTGPDAVRFLERMMTNTMATIKPGTARYTVMCQPDGGCVDDLIVYRISEHEFFICLNAGNAKKDIAWMQEHAKAEGFDVTIRDECDAWAQLAPQGPLAEKIVAKLTDADLGAIKRFAFVVATVAGVEGVIISRTGYTGSAGFELYIPAVGAEKVADALLAAGKPEGMLLAGLGCRDSLRLEAGYPLYGHEISETISPLQGGLGWVVKLDKSPAFIGMEALLAQKAAMPSKVIFFKLNDRRIARQDTPVFAGEKQVGKVLSGTLSPGLNAPIGSALVSCEHADGELAVDLRGNKVPLVVVNEPFHK